VYDRVKNDGHRTNNFCEAAHQKLARELGMKHPTIFKLLIGLKIVQKSRDKLYEDFVAARTPPAKRKKYLVMDEHIKKIVNQGVGIRTKLEYLRGISHYFSIDP
jgi:hypothetical protein